MSEKMLMRKKAYMLARSRQNKIYVSLRNVTKREPLIKR